MSRKRYLPNVNSSGDESVSEDSEYIPSDNEISTESESSDKSEVSENSDIDKENNARRGIKKKISTLLPKQELQSTPRKIGRGRKPVAYKDYVS